MTSRATIAATVTLLRRLALPNAPDFPGTDFPQPLDWDEMVAFASAQLVLPGLHPALSAAGPIVPQDAAQFLSGVHASNAARNTAMRASLIRIGTALNSYGIVPVVLKGAGLLALNEGPATAWRFLSDLDLLVPGDRLADAVEAVRELGFAAQDLGYDAVRDAHYPALTAPGGRFALELHTRVFADRALPLLETRLPADSMLVNVGGARMRVPALPDRLAHLIAHAQIHHAHYGAGRLLLRGFLEMSMLTACDTGPDLWCAVLEPFEHGGQQRAAMGFLAAWRQLMAPQVILPALSQADDAWAQRAVLSLCQSNRTRAIRSLLASSGVHLARALRDPAVLSRHLATLANPKALATRLARHRERLRQAYWV